MSVAVWGEDVTLEGGKGAGSVAVWGGMGDGGTPFRCADSVLGGFAPAAGLAEGGDGSGGFEEAEEALDLALAAAQGAGQFGNGDFDQAFGAGVDLQGGEEEGRHVHAAGSAASFAMGVALTPRPPLPVRPSPPAPGEGETCFLLIMLRAPRG